MIKSIVLLLFITLTLGGNAQVKITEQQKITHLILFVQQLEGAVFIRNGTEHTPLAAAEHLTMKWEKAGSRVKTANDFIDKIANKSSITGELYTIRFSNGKVFPSKMVLANELKKLEEGKVTLRVKK